MSGVVRRKYTESATYTGGGCAHCGVPLSAHTVDDECPMWARRFRLAIRALAYLREHQPELVKGWEEEGNG